MKWAEALVRVLVLVGVAHKGFVGLGLRQDRLGVFLFGILT